VLLATACRESTFWWIEFSLRALWWIEFSLRALSWISRIRSFWLRMPDYGQYFRATVHFVGSAGYAPSRPASGRSCCQGCHRRPGGQNNGLCSYFRPKQSVQFPSCGRADQKVLSKWCRRSAEGRECAGPAIRSLGQGCQGVEAGQEVNNAAVFSAL
jgi:hypothetical protein